MQRLVGHTRCISGSSASSSMSNKKDHVGKYEMGRILGTGNSSVVRLAIHVDTRHAVAIKILNKKKLLSPDRKNYANLISIIHRRSAIQREITIMKMVRHPNVVRIIEVMATKKRIYIVLEYVSGGELFDKIDKKSLTGMSESQARSYFQQLICAVDYCHSRGVTHRDLKPENLLVDDKGVLKVSDFGMSALPQQVRYDGLLHSACGTPNYVAPEVLRNQGYEGAKADIWSCGVILFFLVAGELPFRTADRSDHDALYEKIRQANYTCPPAFSTSLRRLIGKFLDPNTATRITMNEIFEDEWFKRDYKPPQFPQDNISYDHASEPEGMMNAFEILSTFMGFNLLGNFFSQDKGDTRFIAKALIEEINAGIEHVSGTLGFDVNKRSNSQMIITRKDVAGRNGRLSIATKIREMAPPFYMVEFWKAGGDTSEFHRFYNDLSARLQDIIWKAEPLDSITEPGAGASTSTAGGGGGASASTAGASKSTAT